MIYEIDFIKKMVCDLDWHLPKETQEKAIDFLCTIPESYLYLIFDKTKKSTWANAVEIIKRIGFPRNATLLPNLIWLLQDVNWPGATEGVKLLASMDKNTLIPLIEEGILCAYKKHDFMWLGGLNLLVNEAKYTLDDFSTPNVYNLLTHSDF